MYKYVWKCCSQAQKFPIVCTEESLFTQPIHTDLFTSKSILATSASTELDLKRTTFALSPEERVLGSSLENDLHPLYQRLNFKASALTYDTTGEEVGEPLLEARVHERMLPALRLASLLVDFSLPFLTKVFCANLIFVGQQYAFDPTYECTDEDIQHVRGLLLEEWSDRTRFYCKTPRGPYLAGESIMEAVSEVRTGGRPFPTAARSLITIRIDTIDFFSQENYDDIDAETKTSMLVQLAFVLVHEQGHAVFCHRWAEDPELSSGERDFIHRVTPREPMYHLHMEPRYYELGFALQAWVHGGSIFSRGRDIIFMRYPGDVLSESTTAQGYPFRGNLLSGEFWRAVRNAPRPGTHWHAESQPAGWLGQAMEDWRLTGTE